MRPILFTLGDIEVSSSIFFLTLGVIMAIVVGWLEVRRIGIPVRFFHLVWITGVPFALLLAAFNGWLFNVGVFEGLRNIAHADYSGLVSFGAVLGLLGWGYFCARLFRQPTAVVLDTVALILPLCLAVYRIGCMLAGCCYGLETQGLLGFYLPGGGGDWANRYPTQFMLMLLNAGLFAWLWLRRRKKAYDGQQTLYYLMAYSAGRLGIDALRDLPRVLGPFSLHQLTSIAILLITGYTAFELWRERRAASD